MSRTERRAPESAPESARRGERRAPGAGLRAALLLVGVLSGCDLFGNAYSCGYEVGHGSVDALLDAEEERQKNAEAWQQACEPPNAVDARAQRDGDAACAESYTRNGVFTVCDDPGLDVGTQPSGCAPFHKADLALVESDSFDCPGGITGACLCCEDAPTSCSLGGTVCENDAACCSGNCQADDGGPGNHCN